MTPMFLVRRAGMGAALGFAVGLSYFLPAVPVLVDVDAPILDSARTMIGNETLAVMMLAVLLSIASHWAGGKAARVVAAVAAMALTALVMRSLITPFIAVGWFETHGEGSAKGTNIFAVWHIFASGVILAVYFRHVERAQAAAARLLSAQLARQQAERHVLESRLNVMRARVDPEFLFDSLAEVRRTYARDADAAEELLDDLIRFLRASLPSSQERGSTLADEIHLAAAYLRVVSAVRARPFLLSADIPEALGRAFFPPMVLLPLVDDAVRRASAHGVREAGIALRGSIEGGHARVVVEDHADATAFPPHDLEALRATMRAFMGEARVAARADRGGCTVALDFPLPMSPEYGKEAA